MLEEVQRGKELAVVPGEPLAKSRPEGVSIGFHLYISPWECLICCRFEAAAGRLWRP